MLVPIVISLVIGLFNPGTVAAAGIQVGWVTGSQLAVSSFSIFGGPLYNPSPAQSSILFNENPNSQQIFMPGSTNTPYDSTLIANSDGSPFCVVPLNLILSSDGKSVTTKVDIGGPEQAILTYQGKTETLVVCASNFLQGLNNKTYTINGARPSQGPETPAQQEVDYVVWSPVDPTKSPATVQVTFKDSNGKVTTVTSDTGQVVTSDGAGNTIPPSQMYTGKLELPPSTYNACDTTWKQCTTFTKVMYDPATATGSGIVSIGSLSGADTMNVTVNFTVQAANGSQVPLGSGVGPITLTLTETSPTAGDTASVQTSAWTLADLGSSQPISQVSASLTGQFTKVQPGTYKLCVSSITPNVCITATKNPAAVDNEVITLTAAQTAQITATPQSTDVCDNVSYTSLNYWACGFIQMVAGVTTGLDGAIQNLIKINSNQIFNDNGQANTKDAYYLAWASFRDLSYAFLVIILLIAVIAQILGVEFVSAVTLRKLLGSGVVVVVLMPFMWNIMDYLTNMSAASYDVLTELVKAPFAQAGVTAANCVAGAGNDITIGALIPALLTVGALAGAAALAFLGLGGIFMVVLGIGISVASAWFLLQARNIIYTFLVVFSCPALLMRLVPALKKGFDFWGGLVLTVLLSVPGVGIVIQLSHEGAVVACAASKTDGAIIGGSILAGGYFLTWKIFKAIDKAAGYLDGVTAGAAKLAKGARGAGYKVGKRRAKEAVDGTRKFGAAGAMGNVAAGLMQRGQAISREGTIRAGYGAQFHGSEQAHLRHKVEEMMKQDNGTSGGDDLAMTLAMQSGMTDNKFKQDYAARLRAANPNMTAAEAQRRAATAHATLRSSFGAQLGTDAMRVAAYRSLLNSKTSYSDPTGQNGQAVWEQIIGDGNRLMADGLITATDATMFAKAKSDRADRAGVGFGGLQGQFEKSYERFQQGVRAGSGNLVTTDEATSMRREAAFGTNPGGIVHGTVEGVQALSGIMRQDLQTNYTNMITADDAAQNAGLIQTTVGANGQTVVDETRLEAASASANRKEAQAAAAGTGPAQLTQEEQVAQRAVQARANHYRTLAAVAGRYDAMNAASPRNAEELADTVLGQTLVSDATTGSNPTHPQTVLVDRRDQNGNIVTVAVANPRAGQPVTVQDMIEQARGVPRFLEMRHEVSAAAAAQGASAGAIQAPGS